VRVRMLCAKRSNNHNLLWFNRNGHLDKNGKMVGGGVRG